MVSRPGPAECRRSSTQRDPECSGRRAPANPQTRLGMNSLDRRHRGGRTTKQGQIKYADGFMDETDREVSSLTDRAFRSLCVGEEATYTDPELTSSPRDAFAIELPATFQHSFIDSQDQGLRYVSHLSNGAIEATCQNRRSRSRVSSLIKAFSSSEGGSTTDGVLDGCRSDPDGWTWERSALLSLNNELSDFSAYCRDPFTPAASLQASHLGPTSASSKTPKNKASKATFRKLSSINYFLHSEHSPFQTWADYNRIPCEREVTPPTLSPSGFHRWYDSPLYKELTASHRIQTTHSEDVKSYWMPSKDRAPSESVRSMVQPKPAAVEKRCESEVVAKCPPWRKNRNQASNQLPVYRPCTASPCSLASRRRDDASFSGSRPSAIHHQPSNQLPVYRPCTASPCSLASRRRDDASFLGSRPSAIHHQPSNQLPVYRPCTASPCSHASRQRDDASFSGSRPSAVHHQVHTLVGEQTAGSCTPFSISQLLTPVLNARQEMETSEVSQYELSPADDLSTLGDAEPRPPPELKLRNSYKAMASSLLFNLKDNRKRVKSTYSPTKFKGLELSDSDNLPSRQDNAALASKKSASGPPGPVNSTYMQPGAAEASSVYSPALQPTKASAADHTKYTEANRMDDYFTLISPPTVKEAPRYSDSDRITQESTQQRDQLFTSQQSQYRHSQHVPSTSNEILSRNKSNQPIWKEYKTSPTDQLSTGRPTGSTTVTYPDNERRNSFSMKEKDIIRRDEVVHKKMDTTQSLAAFKKLDTGQEVQENRNSPNTDAFNLCENVNVRLTRSSLKADELVLNKPSSQILQVQELGGTTQGIHSLKEKLEADTGSHTSTERQNTTQCLFPQKESEHSRRAMHEIKENPHVLCIGTMNRAYDQTAEIPAKGLNELSSNGLYTVQNDEPATKYTHSLKEKHISGDVLPKPEGPTEKSASQRNEELRDQGEKSVRHSSNRESTSDNYSNYTQAKLRAGQHATGLKFPESDTTAATEQDHMKNAHPSEDYYWAKQGEQMTNEEILNKRHPSVRKTRGEKMLAQNSIKAGTEYELSKGQGSDDPETDGQEKRERFIMNAVRKNDGFVRKKSYQESHAATEREVNGTLKEQGARENKHIKSKQPDAIDEEVCSRMESHPVGNGEAIIGGNDPARCMLAEKCNKHNGLANKDNHKVKHRVFTFNQRDHAMQELLTSKVKAHAQKEIIAIKEKGHAKREGIISSRKDSRERVNDGQGIALFLSHANQGVAIASENWDMKAETPPRECSKTDTLPKIKENEAPQTEVKIETPASQGSQESNPTAPFAKKEGAGNDGLHGKKNAINDRQELLQTANLHIQKPSNVIKEIYSKQDFKQKHDTCISEKKQDPASKEVHENGVGDKRELLSVDSGKAETVPVNSQAEVTPADKQKDNISKKVLSYGEKGHSLNKNASLGEIPKATLEFPAGTTEESDIPHKDRLTNNKQPKQEGLQYKNKEHIQNEATITDKYYPSDQGKFPTEKENRAKVCTLPNLGSTNEKPQKGLLKEKESVNEGDRMELVTKEECSTVVTASMQKVQDGKEDKNTAAPKRNVQDRNEDKSTGTPIRNVQDKNEDKSTGTPIRNVQDKEDDKSTGTPIRNVQDKNEDKSTGTPIRNVQDKEDDKSTGTPIRNVQDKKDDKSAGTPMGNVQSRKEVLGTIENEFVRINVFAITRKVDNEWEDSSSERNDDNAMCDIKEREQIKEEAVTYTVGSENASRINNQTVKTAGEGKGNVKQGLPTKQNCPTSEAITVEEFSKPDIKRPMENDIQGGNATKEITKPVVLKAEEQSKTVPLVKHEHTFPVTQARKGITNECEPASKNHNEDVRTAREHNKAAIQCKVPAMLSTVSPTFAGHTQLETLGKEDSPARKDLQPQKFPKVPTTVEGLEDSMYAKSRYDKQMVFEEQPAEPEIIRTIKSSKPFKVPATENPKFGTDRIKLNISPEVLAKKEDPERNLCYTHNDSTELQTFTTKDHMKVLMSAAEDHKSDGHNQAHAFSAEERKKEASGRKSPKSDVFEMKELTKSGSQGHITRYDSKRPAPKNVQEHNKSGVHVATAITQPGVRVKPEDSKPSELATSEHPKPEVHTKKDIAVFTEHITSATHLMRQHSKHVKPEDSKPVIMEHPKPDVGFKPENVKPGEPVTNEHPKPGVGVKPENIKPGKTVTNEHPKPGVGVKPENIKPAKTVTNEYPKSGVGVKPENIKPGEPVTNEHPKPGVSVKPENIKLGKPVTNEYPKPGVGVKPENIKPGKTVTNEHPKPGVGVKPENIKSAKTVTNEYPKPGVGVKPENIKPGKTVTNEYPKPGVGVKAENIKPAKTVTNEHPKPGVGVKPENIKPGKPVTNEHPKPDVGVKPENIKPGKPVTNEHPKPGVGVKPENIKPGKSVTNEHPKPGVHLKSEHSKPGVLVKTDHRKPDVAVTTEHPKPVLHVKSEHSKTGIQLTTEYPKPGVPRTAEHQKPDIHVKSEDSKPGLPVTTEPSIYVKPGDSKPNVLVSGKHSKPNVPKRTQHPKPVTTEHTKPGRPETTEHPTPGVPIRTEHPKLDIPVTTEHPKPDLRVKSEHNKPGLSITTEHPKPGVNLTAEQPKPGVRLTAEHPKSGMRLTAGHTKPGVPVATQHSKLDASVTIEHPIPGLQVKSEHSKTGVAVTTEHPKPVTRLTAEQPKPRVPITTEHLKPDMHVTPEESKPGLPVTAKHPKPAVPKTTEHPKPDVPLTKEHSTPNVPVTIGYLKPGLHVKSEQSKTVVPVTKGRPKPGVPVTTEHPKPDEPVPMEHPKPVSRAKSEVSKSSVPVTTEHFKPLHVTTEHPKPDEPVTEDHPKPGAPVTTDHLKPVLRIKSEGSKPSIPVTTEHFKSGVPITTEHPKPGVHVTREDSKAGVPKITEHPKPVVCVKQEYSKPHEPVTTDLKPGAPVPKEHTKKCIPVKTEPTTPTLEYTKPVVPLLKEEALPNEHPKAPLRKERHKPNVQVQKEHHEVEPLCKESGNLEMLLKLKGFTSDRVVINNCTVEPAKSEVHATKDSAEAKPKDFSHLGNSHLEMKKDPALVPEEKGQISKHTFPSKEYTKAKMGMLSDKENLNKVRGMHTWMERDQVISMKELEAKEDFTGRQENSVSNKQPIYVETPEKSNESYLSVQEAQQTLEQKLKVRNSPGNTEIIQQRENKEEVEGLQYYAITNHDTEVEPKGILFNSSQKTEMALRTREMEDSGRAVDDGRWTHNTTYPAQAHVLSPQPDTSSPSLGKPTLFKVKDNTFKTSPVTKTVKPYFHKTFPEDLQLSSPINSEKGEDWHDGVSEETKVVQYAEGLSNRFQHSPRSALFSSDSTATEEPHGYFRKNHTLEEDECCSVGSAVSEESCAAGTAHVTNDRAGILGVTEGAEILRGISERSEPTCSGNEGRTFGKPPVVPPKTEKALRRAQKLTTRRIKKAEAKVRPEGTWHLDQTSLRMVSSEPPSPTGQLLSQHLAPSPNAAPRYCMDPGYVPSAPKLVAQPFPLTERKLLQDPNSGQYFMVEVPVPVKTKTFFDPETGKYIQLSVRQSPEGTLSPASSVELLSPPYLLYPGFLTLPVASVPPLRSSSQMSAPAALAEDQEMLELREPWVQKGYSPEFGQDSQMYIEPVYMQHEQPQEPTHTESKSSQRKLNIISMSELEDFAVEST